MKVVVTIPSYTGRIRHDMVMELLLSTMGPHPYVHNVLIAAECSVLPIARSILFGRALENEPDVVVCLDDDTMLLPGGLRNMLEEWLLLREDHPGAVGLSALVPRRDGVRPTLDHSRPKTFPHTEAFGLAAAVLDGHVLRRVWEAAPEVAYDGDSCRMVTPFTVRDGVFIGEDHALCAQLRQHGTLHYAAALRFEHAGRR